MPGTQTARMQMARQGYSVPQNPGYYPGDGSQTAMGTQGRPQSMIPPHGRPQTMTPAQASQAAQAAQVAQSPAIANRLASANAAVTTFQSVLPPHIAPVPRNRPLMAKAGMPYISGGDIVDEIRFPIEDALPVINELTAQKSAAEFSAYLSKKRRQRRRLWTSFWEHRLQVNRRILEAEDQAFNDTQELVAEEELSDDDSPPRRVRKIQVPYIYHNPGSFDIPPPRSVVIPDPQTVARMQAQAAAQQQNMAMTQEQLNAQARAAARMRQSNRQMYHT